MTHTHPHDQIVIGDVSIDLRQRVVHVGTTSVRFTRREFDMLHVLAKHPGWAYTKEQLLDAVWGHGMAANYHAVETMIYWIRRKLRISKTVKIHTLVGYGYKLVVE